MTITRIFKINENILKKLYYNNIHFCWKCVSWNQILSEDFIIEFKDKLDMWHIARNQCLSVYFVKNNLNLLKQHLS